MHPLLALLPLAISPSLADVLTGKPDAAPSGFEEWVSPVVVPSPNTTGASNWDSAVARAKEFVAEMTIQEKVNVTSGQGTFGRCVGNTGVRLVNPQSACMSFSLIAITPSLSHASDTAACVSW
jgi:hypothetical protein